MMHFLLALVDWNNGVIMIGVFALVVVILIAMLFYLMNSGNKSN